MQAAKAETPRLDAVKSAEKPAETVKAVDLPASPAEVKKDTARLPGGVKPELPKRTGQIAVFISRKDSRLYVRQEFKPLFEVPVAIAPSDRPLGTHVFTAEADKNNQSAALVSGLLPMTRAAARLEDEERPSRRPMASRPNNRCRSRIALASARPHQHSPGRDGPHQRGANLGVPIIVDQGINQGETGEGTDFIVSLR